MSSEVFAVPNVNAMHLGIMDTTQNVCDPFKGRRVGQYLSEADNSGAEKPVLLPLIDVLLELTRPLALRKRHGATIPAFLQNQGIVTKY